MDIEYLIKEIHENASKKGFWDDWYQIKGSKKHKGLKIESLTVEKNMINNAIGNRLMMITGEVAEAQEGLRKDDYENFKEELADIVIRVFDLAGGLDIDLEAEILSKMSKNKLRPHLHGKTF